MPNRVEKVRDAKRSEEIAAIGEVDSRRLHDKMNPSGNSKETRASTKPADSSERSEQDKPGATSSNSGDKRHASDGASPSERTANTAKTENKRATVAREKSGEPRGKTAETDTRRNDPDTKVMPLPMPGRGSVNTSESTKR